MPRAKPFNNGEVKPNCRHFANDRPNHQTERPASWDRNPKVACCDLALDAKLGSSGASLQYIAWVLMVAVRAMGLIGISLADRADRHFIIQWCCPLPAMAATPRRGPHSRGFPAQCVDVCGGSSRSSSSCLLRKDEEGHEAMHVDDTRMKTPAQSICFLNRKPLKLRGTTARTNHTCNWQGSFY
jgi:hypothetical protein